MKKTCTECVVSAGTHKPAEALHQKITEPKAMALRLADALEDDETYVSLAMRRQAAAELRSQNARIAELEAQIESIGAGGVESLRGNTAGGVRCHDADACAMGQLPCPSPAACNQIAPAARVVQAAVPEHAFEPVASMLTFVNGQPAKCGCSFSYSDGGGEYSNVGSVTLCATHAGTERNSTERSDPFMWAIQDPDGSAYMDENCVSSVREDVQAEVDGLNSGLDADDDPYKVVPVYLAATQPAAQGMVTRDEAFEAVRKAFCKLQRYSFFLDDKGNVRRCPDHCGNWVEFEAAHTMFDPQFVDAALAAQAKQGG